MWAERGQDLSVYILILFGFFFNNYILQNIFLLFSATYGHFMFLVAL